MYRSFIIAALAVVIGSAISFAQPSTRPATQPGEQVMSAAETIGNRATDTVDQLKTEGLTIELILAWIVGGALVGNLVGSLMTLRTTGFGVVGNLLVGGIGAFVGGFIVRVLGLDFGWPRVSFRLESFLVGCIFAIILVLIYRKVKGGMHNMTAPGGKA